MKRKNFARVAWLCLPILAVLLQGCSTKFPEPVFTPPTLKFESTELKFKELPNLFLLPGGEVCTGRYSQMGQTLTVKPLSKPSISVKLERPSHPAQGVSTTGLETWSDGTSVGNSRFFYFPPPNGFGMLEARSVDDWVYHDFKELEQYSSWTPASNDHAIANVETSQRKGRITFYSPGQPRSTSDFTLTSEYEEKVIGLGTSATLDSQDNVHFLVELPGGSGGKPAWQYSLIKDGELTQIETFQGQRGELYSDSEGLYLALYQEDDGHGYLTLRSSKDEGESWQPLCKMKLLGNEIYSYRYRVTDNFHWLTYSDGELTAKEMSTYSLDHGKTWSEPELICHAARSYRTFCSPTTMGIYFEDNLGNKQLLQAKF